MCGTLTKEVHYLLHRARGRGRRDDRSRKWVRKAEVGAGTFSRMFLAVSTAEKNDRLHLHLCKDVTKNDLEMFQPSTKVRM